MKRILFVDDNVHILEELRDKLTGRVPEWEFHFAGNAGQAVSLIQQKAFDVVVTDNDIGGITGNELLRVAARTIPGAIRISLAECDNPEEIFQGSSLAHQYITKPCDADSLLSALLSVFELRGAMSTPEITHLLNCIQTLPSMPTLYMEIMAELRSPSSSLQRVGNIVSKDIAMTAKVLQLANSAFYAFNQRITDPGHAVMILGSGTITTLALTLGVFARAGGRVGALDINDLMDHSTVVAYTARELAVLEGLDTPVANIAFLSGFLHDVGRLILADNFPSEYSEANRMIKEDGVTILEAERRMFGATHADIGAYLLNLWGLPDPVIETVLRHHTPDSSMDTSFSPLTAVHLANNLANSVTGRREASDIDASYISRLGVDIRHESWEEIFRRAVGVLETA